MPLVVAVVVGVAAIAFVVAIAAVPAFVPLPAILACVAVRFAGAVPAVAVLAAAFRLLLFLVLSLVLCGEGRERQGREEYGATQNYLLHCHFLLS